MAREDEAAFDSKYLLGLKVSHGLLSLLCSVYHSVIHQFLTDFDVQVLSFFSVAISFVFFVFPDNCVKHSGSMQEGMNFEDNSHNSLEPRG